MDVVVKLITSIYFTNSDKLFTSLYKRVDEPLTDAKPMKMRFTTAGKSPFGVVHQAGLITADNNLKLKINNVKVVNVVKNSKVDKYNTTTYLGIVDMTIANSTSNDIVIPADKIVNVMQVGNKTIKIPLSDIFT